MDEQFGPIISATKSAPPKVPGRVPARIRTAREKRMSTPAPLRYEFDESLVDRVRAGDFEAFHQLLRPLEYMIFRVACALSSEELAEQVAQDAVARAWRGFREFCKTTCLRAWVARQIVDAARVASGAWPRYEKAIDDSYSPLNVEEWQQIPPNALEDPRSHNDIQSALAALPTERREIFVLRDIAGFRVAECAGILGIGEQRARDLLLWARLQFRDELLLVCRNRLMKSA